MRHDVSLELKFFIFLASILLFESHKQQFRIYLLPHKNITGSFEY